MQNEIHKANRGRMVTDWKHYSVLINLGEQEEVKVTGP